MTADWTKQHGAFADPLRRNGLPPAVEQGGAERQLRIGVLRNDACEPTLNLAVRFGAYADVSIAWAIDEYDDTLTPRIGFDDLDGLLVWIDWRRLDFAAKDVIEARLDRLRVSFGGSIALLPPHVGEAADWATWVTQWCLKAPGVQEVPVTDLVGHHPMRDSRLASVAGSDLSAHASLLIARWIGITWGASLAYPPLKLIAVDLDNTLHAGVLGEDGVLGVVIDDGKRLLGEALRGLRDRGVLLALVTKNDPADVDELLDQRSDLALSREDFIQIRATWDPKTRMIEDIAAALGISPDACALIDDNPGELTAARAAGLWAIDATDSHEAARVLSLLPRVATSDSFARAREADIKAARTRREAQSDLDSMSLHHELGTGIECAVDGSADLERVADLLARTNQFNCRLARTPRSVLDRLVADPSARVATVRVHDRLSDSGVVGALILERDESERVWDVREFVLSCRILGRGLEDALFAALIDVATGEQMPMIRLEPLVGPRNEPALRWAGDALLDDGSVSWAAIRSAEVQAVLALLNGRGASEGTDVAT